MENTVKFPRYSFGKRLRSMLKVDFRRMFKSKLFYILIVCALVMPVLMTVMMTMMDGSVSVDPQTGVETIMEGPENTWQNIGTLPDGEDMGGSDVFMMCNINMVFMIAKVFLMLVFIAIFVLISVAAKQRAWLALCGSLGGGMLLFMMVSMITPLGSTAMNVLLCLIGGLVFAFGLGAISKVVLSKTSLV